MNKNISDILGDRYGSPDFSSIQFFSSKKNTVARITDELIKYYVFGDSEKVKQVYRKCERSGVKVPELLAVYPDILVFRFIENKPIEEAEKVRKIFGWLKDFHTNTGLCKGDQRLHNYLWDGTHIYGIDFEESFQGDLLDDIAQLCVTLLKKYNIDEIGEFLGYYSEDLDIADLRIRMKKDIKLRSSWGEIISADF